MLTTQTFTDRVEEFRPTLMSMALKFYRDYSTAEDVVQTVIMKAIRFGYNYIEDGKFRAWMSRILKNTMVSRHRLKYNQEVVGIPKEEGYNEKVDLLVDSHEIDVDAQDELRLWLARLSNNHRAIIEKRIDGYSIEEIAAQLKIPPGTVMSSLYRARTIIKECINRN